MVERPSRDLAALPVRRPDEPLPNQGAPFHYSRQWHVPSRVRDSRSPMTVGVRALRLGFLLDVGLHVPFDLMHLGVGRELATRATTRYEPGFDLKAVQHRPRV